MGFDPALGDVAMVLKTCKPFRILDKFVNKVFDGELDIAQDAAWVAVVPYASQKRGEYPVHLEQLEVEVADAGMSEFAITGLECHQFPSAMICSMRRRLVLRSRSMR